ncbi:MAG TPA: agmatinase, partial [Kiritimatiellia bacterium]|nr:agmatinase [Kiritimatiellia bacterium]
ETTVCYGGGTSRAPRAILEASRQLDDFDGRRWPTDLAIHTQPFVKPAAGKKSPTERWLAAIEKAVGKALRCGALPAVLGGEHTATLGSARAFKAAGADIGFIHFDAHADLRDVYKGTKLSHACVLRRVHELGFPLVQLATRAVSREEADYRAENEKTIRAYDARFLAAGKLPKKWIPKDFPKQVFISFDLDAFDPAVIPATGTPVPGGIGWRDALKLIDDVASARKIVGFDVLELAPMRGLHHPDYTAALLVYALMAAAARS